MPTVRPRRLATGLALTLALSGAVAACGDDDTAGADVTSAACDAFTALSGALAGDPGAIGELADDFERTAPADLADRATSVAGAYRSLASGGDPSAFGDEAYLSASSAIADDYFAGCDLSEQLSVDGIDFGFEGLPEQVAAGRVGIRFTNRTEHDEAHELVLFRRNPGTDESVAELLALPEEETMAKLTMAGVLFADRPDDQAVSMVDLEPGRYVAVCFIPVGGTEDGLPHAMSGMVGEFEAS